MIALREKLKVDLAVPYQQLATTNATGAYFDRSGYRSALFMVHTGAIAKAATVIAQVMHNNQAGASNAAVLTNYAATITGAVRATRAQIVVGGGLEAGNKLKINGVEFECVSSSPGPTEFTNAAGLNTAINAYFDDIMSSLETLTLTLVSTDPGKTTITLSDDTANLTVSTLEAISFIEVPEHVGNRWAAVRLTTSATISTGAVLLRGDPRYMSVEQAVGAQYPT